MIRPPALDDDELEAPFASLEWLPVYVAYAGVGLLLLTIALAAYAALTPTSEFRAMRAGNPAATISLAGALVGLALPLAAVVQRAESLFDLLVWAVAALLVQLLIVLVLRRIAPAFDRELASGRIDTGIFLAALSIVIGLLNAAAVRL